MSFTPNKELLPEKIQGTSEDIENSLHKRLIFAFSKTMYKFLIRLVSFRWSASELW